jgi:hypothetical protein
MLHTTLKLIPVLMFALDKFLQKFFTPTLNEELIILFTVIDFWITKNYNGKRMLGQRWFFGEDEKGVERLMVEFRVNGFYNKDEVRIYFWVVLSLYTFAQVSFIVTLFYIAPNVPTLNFRWISIAIIMMISGTSNMALFFVATKSNLFCYNSNGNATLKAQKGAEC